MTQQAVSIATTGIPGPLRSVLTSRVGAPLTLLVVGGLVATGVIHFQLLDGRPSVSIDRQRAAEVKQEIKQYVEDADLSLPASLPDPLARRTPLGSGPPAAAVPDYGNSPVYPAAVPQPGYGGAPVYPAAGQPSVPPYSGGSRRLRPFFSDRPTKQR